MNARPVAVGIYAEVDMNLIDGSSIWLASVAETISRVQDVHVTVLLRTPPRRPLLLAPLQQHRNIQIVDPATRGVERGRLEAADAAKLLDELDRDQPLDVLLLRGPAVADEVVSGGRFDSRMWLYHVPQDGVDDPDEQGALQRRTAACARVLCQTSAIAARLADAVPGVEEKLLLLPPMVPDELAQRPPASGPVRRLMYAGKFSPGYFFLEMVSLFDALRERLPELEWDVAGDKIHDPPSDPDFRSAARHALESTDGLRWHRGVSRERVRELLLDADVALSLRHPQLDSSIELSTKVLEYGAAGVPALVNRNPAHVELLGHDYPLLAGDLEEARRLLLEASEDPDLRTEAAHRCREAAEPHTFSRIAETLEPHLRPAPPARGSPPQAVRQGSPRLLFLGHQFNFLGQIRDHALARGAAVREVLWPRDRDPHDPEIVDALEWAEVIHCEWCLWPAVWCSRHKRPDQRLVVRFHRMELETEHPRDLDLGSVDALVFVAHHVLESACQQYGWPRDHGAFRVIPNAVDTVRLAREKLPDAQFTLGLLGWVPMLKRVDRALEILERLRARDERFRLIIKGTGPWDYDWMAGREAERAFYEQALARVERSPLLGSAVLIEPFGEDVAAFLQEIGWVLSLSTVEGHAVAPAEGMASGAIPVVIDRPGAAEQYPPQWIHPDPEHAAWAILSLSANGGLGQEQALARRLAEGLDISRLTPLWGQLLRLAE